MKNYKDKDVLAIILRLERRINSIESLIKDGDEDDDDFEFDIEELLEFPQDLPPILDRENLKFN
jgi:hypothetical protein